MKAIGRFIADVAVLTVAQLIAGHWGSMIAGFYAGSIGMVICMRIDGFKRPEEIAAANKRNGRG